MGAGQTGGRRAATALVARRQRAAGAAARETGSVTVVIALLANILVAIAKTVATVLTGSAAMLAESAHSWADAVNEIFLLIADRSGSRPRDPDHPFGFGRDAWIWSMFAAIGVFAVGATVSVFHGIQTLFEPDHTGPPLINYVVLAIALVLEGTSFLQSLRQARKNAGRYHRDVLDYVAGSSESTLRAVFAEDGAAIIGVVLAAAGVFLHQVTGQPFWDAAASIAIGLLLAVVALFLIARNRRLLIGGSAPGPLRDRIIELLDGEPTVDHVTYLHVEIVGPRQLFVAAAVDLIGDDRESTAAEKLRAIEDHLEADELIQTAVLTIASYREPAIEPGDSAVDVEDRGPGS